MPKDGAMTLNSSAMNRSDAILFAVVSSDVTRSVRICDLATFRRKIRRKVASRSVLGSSFLYPRVRVCVAWRAPVTSKMFGLDDLARQKT